MGTACFGIYVIHVPLAYESWTEYFQEPILQIITKPSWSPTLNVLIVLVPWRIQAQRFVFIVLGWQKYQIYQHKSNKSARERVKSGFGQLTQLEAYNAMFCLLFAHTIGVGFHNALLWFLNNLRTGKVPSGKDTILNAWNEHGDSQCSTTCGRQCRSMVPLVVWTKGNG